MLNAKSAKWIAVAVVGAMILGALGRGDWGHQVASLGALLWLGMPALVAACILAVRRQVKGALMCVGAVAFIALQLGFGIGILRWDIYRSQQYCESLVPILDEIYRSKGRYPPTLHAEPSLPPPTSWQFNADLLNYYSDGATFSFDVNNPAEIFGGFIYRHDMRQWEAWRD